MINIEKIYPGGAEGLDLLANEFADRIINGRNNSKPLKESLEEARKKRSHKHFMGFFNYLLKDDNLENLITARPGKLNQLREKIEKDYSRLFSKGKAKSRRKVVLEAFRYKQYRKTQHFKWLGEKLNIRTCPYCCSQYTLYRKAEKNGRIKYGDSQLLYQVDHFFPKEKFPYLSMSFFNLIPSCASCNITKSDKDIAWENLNVNPYYGISLDDFVRFAINDSDLLKRYIGEPEDYRIVLNPKEIGQLTSVQHSYLSRMLEIFKLDDLYQEHKDLTEELIIKSEYYNPSRKAELEGVFSKLFGIKYSREMIDRMVVGNYYKEEDLLKRPLAKFSKDLATDLKLLDW